MFQLTQNEYDRLRSQNVILKRGQHFKYMPYAFTEHGILMLSSVLKSQRAEKVNMLIIDTFVKIRELIFLNKDLVHQLEQVRNRLTNHDSQIKVILGYLKQIEKAKEKELEQMKRPRIGFKP
ncbi:MAG: ORF6N domain-containing protein [Bacteroidetes bacterium]|nr:MAG: ORF6N domain-containing protein [Bacteroidota bacterium]